MGSLDDDLRLSRIQTLWSVVRQAHGENSVQCRSAQEQIIEKYRRAIRKYLIAALRDESAAEEVFQEFALRFVRGDFQSADPDRGMRCLDT